MLSRIWILRFNEKWKRRSSEHSSRWHGSDSLTLHNSEGIDRSSPFIADLISHPPYSNFRSSRGYRPSRDDSQIWNLTRPWEHASVFIKRVEMKKIDPLQKGGYYVAPAWQLTRIVASEIKLTRKKKKKKRWKEKSDLIDHQYRELNEINMQLFFYITTQNFDNTQR